MFLEDSQTLQAGGAPVQLATPEVQVGAQSNLIIVAVARMSDA